MHERTLLPHPTIQLETLQRSSGVFADVDMGISQSKQLVMSHEGAANGVKTSVIIQTHPTTPHTQSQWD